MKTRSIAASMALFALLAGCSTTPSTTPVTDETTTGTTTPTTTDQTAATGEVFATEDLNFSITIPTDWNGITQEEKDTTWAFGTTRTIYIKDATNSVDIFAVTMFTKDQWAAVQASEGPKPTFITEKNGFVWAYDQTQDPTGVEKQVSELPQVLATFQAK